jgi:hypothetical protein
MFVGLSLNKLVWDATVFTKNRDQLMVGGAAREFFQRVVKQAQERIGPPRTFRGWHADPRLSIHFWAK